LAKVTPFKDHRMAHKPRKRSREPTPTIHPKSIFPPRFRAPRELRAVSTITIRDRDRGQPSRKKRRLLPQIRLSGAWLEQIGFARGRRFIVLADVPNQIVLALVDV
jgi:hypothetical protein